MSSEGSNRCSSPFSSNWRASCVCMAVGDATEPNHLKAASGMRQRRWQRRSDQDASIERPNYWPDHATEHAHPSRTDGVLWRGDDAFGQGALARRLARYQDQKPSCCPGNLRRATLWCLADPSPNTERPVSRIAGLARAMIGCHCSTDRVGDRTVAAIVVDQRIANSGSGGRVGVWLAGGRLCRGDGMGRR
jgi:hypothetical protein